MVTQVHSVVTKSYPTYTDTLGILWNTQQLCGPRKYEFVMQDGSTPPDFVYFSSDGLTIIVHPTLSSHVGEYPVALRVSLRDYPEIYIDELFDLVILECVI